MHYDTRNNLWVSSTDNGAKQKNILITTAGANRGVSHFEAFFLGGVGEVFACGTGRGSWCWGRVQSPNDVIQKIEKTRNNTHTTTQKRTNNIYPQHQQTPENWKWYY